MSMNDDIRGGWDALTGKRRMPRVEEYTPKTELHVKGFMVHDVQMPDVKMLKPSVVGQNNYRPKITYFQMDVHRNFTPPNHYPPKLDSATPMLNTHIIKNPCPYYDVTAATGLNKRRQRQQEYEPPDEMPEREGDDE